MSIDFAYATVIKKFVNYIVLSFRDQKLSYKKLWETMLMVLIKVGSNIKTVGKKHTKGKGNGFWFWVGVDIIQNIFLSVQNLIKESRNYFLFIEYIWLCWFID